MLLFSKAFNLQSTLFTWLRVFDCAGASSCGSSIIFAPALCNKAGAAGREIYLEALQDMHNEIQDVLGQSFALPDDIDEEDLMEELDALEDEMASELESGNRAGVPSYLQVSFWLSNWDIG